MTQRAEDGRKRRDRQAQVDKLQKHPDDHASLWQISYLIQGESVLLPSNYELFERCAA
jgi:hypothetical protein